MTETAEGRDTRQRELVPPARLAKIHAVVVGVGAIGRQVALQLAATGVRSMALIDHGRVEEVNLGPQGYKPFQVGSHKVLCTHYDCRELNPELRAGVYAARFQASALSEYLDQSADNVVFCCVDSMEVRKFIWESIYEKAALFVDGRMSAEVIRVLVAEKPELDDHYETTLFADAEAHQDSCTARSTIYTASIAAGLMVGAMTRWMRDLPLDRDVLVNLLSMEMTPQ